jgi:hypothetical protein
MRFVLYQQKSFVKVISHYWREDDRVMLNMHIFHFNYITTLDEAKKSVCVFMDLSKACDTVNIDILIEKLNHY